MKHNLKIKLLVFCLKVQWLYGRKWFTAWWGNCIKNVVFFYRSVTYYFTEKSLEGLKQIHQEVCSQHKSIFNLEYCMIFNKDLQLRQLFSTFLKPVPRVNLVTQSGLDSPRLCESWVSWTPCLTQWHWGLFCLLLNPQLWCWKFHFRRLLWLLSPLSLLPLHPPDWPWDNCAQGTSGDPIRCPCIHNFLFVHLKSHIVHFSWCFVSLLMLNEALPCSGTSKYFCGDNFI